MLACNACCSAAPENGAFIDNGRTRHLGLLLNVDLAGVLQRSLVQRLELDH